MKTWCSDYDDVIFDKWRALALVMEMSLYGACISDYGVSTGKGSEEFGLKHSQVHAGASSGEDMAPVSRV